MSWLARSIANSLKLDDDDDDDDDRSPNSNVDSNSNSPSNPQSDDHAQSPSPPSPSSTVASTTPRGVKEDLSELTKTLTRQFWGVASFLAPPPDPSSPSSPHSRQISDEPTDNPQPNQLSDSEESDEDLIAGIRSDFAEIGGRFKSGISKLSSNVTVSEITKIASNLLQIGPERDLNDEFLIGSAVGVTEDVVTFARDIAMHPQTWLDFPVPDDEDFDDFDMSDAQKEHALAVEHLVPRLSALRIEFCPGHMSEGCFWKIYFVLLHPRLSKHDAELLSTPQIMKVRAMLSQELHDKAKATKADWSETGTFRSKGTADLPHEESLPVPSHSEFGSVPLRTSIIEVVPPNTAAKTSGNEAIPSGFTDEQETEKHPVQSIEMQIIDKAVVKEESVDHAKHRHLSGSTSKIEDDADDWLREESSEMVGTSGTTMHIRNDEDVSFSDLEEDDGDEPTSYKEVILGSDASTKDSRDWVQFKKGSSDSV